MMILSFYCRQQCFQKTTTYSIISMRAGHVKSRWANVCLTVVSAAGTSSCVLNYTFSCHAQGYKFFEPSVRFLYLHEAAWSQFQVISYCLLTRGDRGFRAYTENTEDGMYRRAVVLRVGSEKRPHRNKSLWYFLLQWKKVWSHHYQSLYICYCFFIGIDIFDWSFELSRFSHSGPHLSSCIQVVGMSVYKKFVFTIIV